MMGRAAYTTDPGGRQNGSDGFPRLGGNRLVVNLYLYPLTAADTCVDALVFLHSIDGSFVRFRVE